MIYEGGIGWNYKTGEVTLPIVRREFYKAETSSDMYSPPWGGMVDPYTSRLQVRSMEMIEWFPESGMLILESTTAAPFCMAAYTEKIMSHQGTEKHEINLP